MMHYVRIRLQTCAMQKVHFACPLPPTRTQTEQRAQLVSLINPNEVGLYYQKWEEQQVLLSVWHITSEDAGAREGARTE